MSAQRRIQGFWLAAALLGACELVAPLGPEPEDVKQSGAGGTGNQPGGEHRDAAGSEGTIAEAGSAGLGGGSGCSNASSNGCGIGVLEGGGPTASSNGGAAGLGGAGEQGGEAGSAHAGRKSDVGASGASGGDTGIESAAGAGGRNGPEMVTPWQHVSCVDQTTLCGVDQEDCCASPAVRGGVYLIGSVGPTAVVDDFYLDRFEVTVGRYQAFLRGFTAWRAAGNPAPGAGALRKVPGSGWVAAFSVALHLQSVEEIRDIKANCGAEYTLDRGDALPMNCVTWYQAQAFCIWDGGRLPTNVEWEYATLGGDEYRTWPWGFGAIDSTRAVYGCLGDGSSDCAFSDILEVGRRPLGNGRFGQSDLSGSLSEHVFDFFGDYPEPCDNCALIQGAYRVFRGGAWNHAPGYLEVTRRDFDFYGSQRAVDWGFRCARSVVE